MIRQSSLCKDIFRAIKGNICKSIRRTKKEIKSQTRYIRATISCQITCKKFAELHDNAAENFISDREHCRGRASCQAALPFYYDGFHFISGLRGTPFPDSEY